MNRNFGRVLRLTIAAALVAALLALTGCVDLLYSVNVKDNGSGSIAMSVRLDKALMDSMSQKFTDASNSIGGTGTVTTDSSSISSSSVDSGLGESLSKMQESAKGTGVKVTAVQESGKVGYLLSSDFASPEALPAALAAIARVSGGDTTASAGAVGASPLSGQKTDVKLSLDREIFSTGYTLTMNFPGIKDNSTRQMMSTAGVNVSVDARMPGTVESTNGSKAPDGSIQWKIDYSEATDKVLTVKSSTPNWVGVIGVGVLVLLVLGGVIVALLRRRGKPVPMVQTDSTEA